MNSTSIFWIMLPAFCECLVLVGIHSYLGIHVIKRKVIFVDLAFAQISALGTLIAFLFGIPPHTFASFWFALFLTAIGATVFSIFRFRRSKVPQEALIGLVYAIAAAMAILLIDKAPHGAEHLKEIFTGSILWVKWSSILTAAAVYSMVGIFHYVYRRRFLAISEDPDAAAEAGVRVRLWDFLFYMSFGLVITLSVDIAGVLIVFVFLVAPAILAMVVSQRLKVQLFVGWGLGVVVTTVGLVLAYVKDLSTGPAVIAVYGVTLILVGTAVHVIRAPRRLAALGHAAGIAAGFAAAFLLLYGAGTLIGPRFRREEVREVRAAEAAEEAREADRPAAPDPMAEADTIVKALSREGPGAVRRAVEFLAGNPSPFFREQVTEALRKLMDIDPGFRPDEPMTSAANRKALAKIRSFFRIDQAGR